MVTCNIEARYIFVDKCRIQEIRSILSSPHNIISSAWDARELRQGWQRKYIIKSTSFSRVSFWFIVCRNLDSLCLEVTAYGVRHFVNHI